ncbi:hypothetical protein SAMN02910400_01872 [Lachnospiraceae bacterium C10]|nr:hypothetical protein SAMN02910400_01872 [Lachnospiraceae bacterium C10]
MKIKSVKAKYELQAAPKLKICFEIDQDEAMCGSSFDPESEDYGLIGMLRIYDETEEDLGWEDGLPLEYYEKIDLRAKLQYGFLDELIEKAIFKRLREFHTKIGNPDKIGSYWTDDPAVVWLMRKETFEKVVRGWAIRDRKVFQAEIIGEKENGETVKIHLPENTDIVKNFKSLAELDLFLAKPLPDIVKSLKGNKGKVFMEVVDEIVSHM